MLLIQTLYASVPVCRLIFECLYGLVVFWCELGRAFPNLFERYLTRLHPTGSHLFVCKRIQSQTYCNMQIIWTHLYNSFHLQDEVLLLVEIYTIYDGGFCCGSYARTRKNTQLIRVVEWKWQNSLKQYGGRRDLRALLGLSWPRRTPFRHHSCRELVKCWWS